MGHLCPRTASPGRQWVFHPLWSFAWADQEELIYLRQAQLEIANLREVAQQRSWLRLKEQITAQQNAYHRPTAGWRFYPLLPFADRLSEVVGTPTSPNRLIHLPIFQEPGSSA